jgi:hypothetical protein
MSDEISELISKDSKVVFTHLFECKKINKESNVTAIIMVFDDGHTEVRCPITPEECNCSYGDRSRPITQKKRGLKEKLTDLVLRILILAAVIFPLVIAGINLFKDK